jgi:hypothetical protein
MKKIIISFVLIISFPSIILAHNPGGAMISYGIIILLAIIFSLIILRLIDRFITIQNRFLKILTLTVIGIVLSILLTILLGWSIGDLIYFEFFGG